MNRSRGFGGSNNSKNETSSFSTCLPWLLPILIFILFAAISWPVDLIIERKIYESNGGQFVNHSFTTAIFDWAVIPAIALAIIAGFAFLLSYTKKEWRSWRKPSFVLVLTMAVGAGFITHTVLKDHWGRPRPKQLIEFGGIQEFRAVYEPNFFHQPEPSKSFPCGHCTMGFYFFALIFLGRRFERPWMTYLGWFLAITLGIALGITRMVQGGHFLSDVVCAGVIMWLTALVSDWLVYPENSR